MTDRVWINRPDKPGLWWWCVHGDPRSMRIAEYLRSVDEPLVASGTMFSPVLDTDLPKPPKEAPQRCKWCGETNRFDSGRWLCGSSRGGEAQSDACRLSCLQSRYISLLNKAKAVVDSYWTQPGSQHVSHSSMERLRKELEEE